MRKGISFLLLSILIPALLMAQVTTGSITGTINESNGHALAGASVKAIHLPTGSVYTSATKSNGQYTLPNLRVGGPYQVVVTYVGFKTNTINDLYVSLGSPIELDLTLESTSNLLEEVKVTTTSKKGVISSQRNGASTTISSRELQSLPTLSRSIQDFVRLTPQAIATTSNSDGSPLGISFAGQNNRYNQFTVDGANANDVFGLSGSGTNGGQAGANPIPLESIQEVQILLSPYDITQGGFTGGGINAVTKSGTNKLHGVLYGSWQNQNLVGKGVQTNAAYQTFKNSTYGANLGGALIKNKLFYFVNFEKFDNSVPLAFDPSDPNSGSKFGGATALQSIHDFVLNTYKYEVGGFTGINKAITSTSLFARIDWNINDKNKLTIRHSYVDGSNYVISRSPTSVTYANGGYYFLSTTNSTVLELNSSISSNSSNVLRITYNNIRDRRTTAMFPNVSITQNGLGYNFGAEFSSSANSLGQDNFTLVDNYTLYKKNHTITIGTNNEFYNTNNVFLQAYSGAYTYNKTTSGYDNIAAFENNNTAPSAYTINYATSAVGDKAPAKIHAAQFSVYGQDVWTVNNNFKLTYGLRIDLPVYFNKPDANASFNSDAIYSAYQSNNIVPKSNPLFSPRVGFNWNVNGEGIKQIRGGIGLFTGRAPFVWISNSYGTNGVASIKYTTVPTTLRFNYDPTSPVLGAYVPSGNTPSSTEVDITNPKFKVPQILRTNLAIDQKLGFWGLIGTLEGVVTKKINDINYQNLSVAPANGVVNIGNSTRPWYNFSRVNSNFTDVVQLTNTNQGFAYNITLQVQKPLSRGWSGMFAYTYGESLSLNDGTSSVAMSNWRFAYNTNGLNSLDLARANYDPGHRIVGYISKTFKYANNHLATTIGLVYTGQSGQPFSYTYSKNISGDDITGKTGNNNADLIYVPSDQELNNPTGYTSYQLVNLTTTSNGVTTVIKTAAQEWADFKDFINNNPKLAASKGRVIERNGDRTPFESHFDLKIAQDFYFIKEHKVQVAFDIMNLGNLLNKNAGWSYGTSNQDVSPLTVVSQSTTPTFTFDNSKLNSINGNLRPYFVNDLLSRWRAQISVRYSF